MRVLSCLLITLLATLISSGQTITGVVVDTNGSAIRDAEVSLLNRNISVATVRTDSDGSFALSGKINSNCRLVVYASTFSRFERRLQNDGVRDFAIVLEPATVNESVTVDGGLVLLGGTPASVVGLSRAQIDQTSVQTLDDGLRQSAGFALFRRSSSKTSNPTAQGANLRGVSGSGAARTAVLFDGLSLNDAFGGWTYWSRVPMIAVEHVEVLRGGASSLYGSGGLSGAVNVVPIRKVGIHRLRGQASAGTQNTFDGSVAAGYSWRRWSFDLAAEAFGTDGYVPVDEFQRGAADTRANSRHQNFLFSIERRFGRYGSASTGRLFLNGNIFSEDRDNGTRLTENSTYFRQASGGGDIERRTLGKFQIRAYIQSQVYDQTFSAVSADRNTETLTRIQRVPSQATGGSASWTRSFGEHTLSSSFELRRVRGFSEEVGLSAGAPTSISRSGGTEDTIALSVQDHVWLGPRFTLTFGGRYDAWKNYNATLTTRSLVSGVVTTTAFLDRTDKAFSPRAGLLFTMNRYVGFYGAYSRSFRAPTLNELYRGFRVGNVVTQANENLRAETADTFEGGFHLNTLDRRHVFRANVFTTGVADPIVGVTISTTPTLITRQRQNVGRTRSSGIELEAEFAPLANFGIGVSYLFVDARVTEFPASPELVGRRLPQVPRQQLNLQFRYRPIERWFAGLSARASSGQFEDDLNTFRLRPFITFDASSTFRLPKGIEIFGVAENIFNSRYDIGLTPNRTVAAPVSLRLGLRFDLSKR